MQVATASTARSSGGWGRGLPSRAGPDGGIERLCILAYVALLPVQVALTDTFRVAPSDLFVLAYLVLRLPRMVIRPRAWSGWHAAIVISLAIGSMVAEVLGGIALDTIGQKLVGLLWLMVTALCVQDSLTSWERLRSLLRVLILSASVHTFAFLVVMYLQQAGAIDRPDLNLDGARLTGLLIDPNAFGALVLVALVLAAVGGGRGILGRDEARLVTPVLALGLAATYSRSAWLGLAFACAAALWVAPRPALSAGIRGAVIGLTLLPLLWVLAPTDAGELARRPGQVEERFSIIADATADLVSSPVVGIGLGTSFDRHGQIVHNTTLWFFTEFGLLGLISILGFVWWHAARAQAAHRRLRPPQRAVAAGLLVAHVGMWGVSMGIEALYQRHWWVVLAAICALSSHDADVPAAAPPPPPPRYLPAEVVRPARRRAGSTLERMGVGRDVLSSASWGVLDQAVSSGTNFALALVVVRSVPTDDFGAFSFVVVLHIVAIGVVRSVCTEALVIRTSGSMGEIAAASRSCAGAVVCLGAASGLLCVVAAVVVGGPMRSVLLVLGLSLPLLLLQDAGRHLSFARLEPRLATVSDLAWAVVLLVLVLALAALSVDDSWVYLLAWAVGGGVGAALLVRSLPVVPAMGEGVRWLASTWSLGRSLLANYSLTAAPTYLLLLVTPLVADIATLAEVRAAFIPFGVLGVVFQGIAMLAVPYCVRAGARAELRRRAVLVSAVLAVAAVAWGAVVLAVPDAVGTRVIGDLWQQSSSTRAAFALAVIFEGAGIGAVVALQALSMPSRLVQVRLVVSPLTLALGVALIRIIGAPGVAVALAVGHGAAALLIWGVARRQLSGDPAPPADLVIPAPGGGWT